MDINKVEAAEHFSKEVESDDIVSIQKVDGKYKEIQLDFSETVDDYMHLIYVAVNRNGIITFIHGHHEMLQLQGTPTGRGTTIYTGYSKENGEFFESRQTFHKGHVFKEVELIGKTVYPEGADAPIFQRAEGTGGIVDLTGLWRD
ncbi:TPA: hypothetical protein QCX52_005075 [Bacillus toyonensis]|nr:hypothetical protein [Bacillus toyonensis]